jgi:hypothetical protein
MDKGQALQAFWSGFGLPAHEQGTVGEDDQMPYITYEVAFGNFETTITLTADIWYYDSGWETADKKAEQISKAIGYLGIIMPISGGYMWVKRQQRFSEHATDPNDMVRRVHLFIEVDFLTED